jgi:histidinol-phosphate aminotransferase
MANTTSFSRRGFTKILGAGAAYTALRPSNVLPAIHPPSQVVLTGAMPANVVRLSSNENPYGPSPASLKAMTDGFSLAWRYPDEYYDTLVELLAKSTGIPPNQFMLGNGSGEILKVAAMAFTGAGKRVAIADPTFEAIAHHAQNNGAEIVKVPLTANYSHDLMKMLDAAKGAGLVYICNPNNPTATITSRAAVRDFLNGVPRTTTVLIDEAYFHYVEINSDYESGLLMMKDYPNLIVARTFSKIYGMAGLRCGYCVAHPDKIKLMRAHQVWDSINIMAILAALASLQNDEHAAQSYRKNLEVKKFVYAELEKLGYRHIPSQANFMMIDLRRDVKPLIKAMADHGVEVGRFFPALPNFMRVTIGTKPQMESFVSTLRTVMG